MYLIVYIYSLKRHFNKKNNQILNLNINDIESIESIDINHKNENKNIYEDEIESDSYDEDTNNDDESKNKNLLGRKNKKRRICNL